MQIRELLTMSRIRSPGYPNAPLQEVIAFASKIHEKDRQYAVSRDVACQHMGFTGASGSSDRAISALFHYGLAEKVVKGEIRVTALAVRILHPDSPQERRDALHEAGFKPGLFQDLREKYPDNPPSLSTLTSYLKREGFAEVAIPPAAKAFLATCEFLQRENAYESVSAEAEDEAPSPPTSRREEPANMHTQLVPVAPQSAPIPPMTPPTAYQLGERSLFDYGVEAGGTVSVVVRGSVDTDEALDIVATWIEVKRKELARKARLAVVRPASADVEIEEVDPLS